MIIVPTFDGKEHLHRLLTSLAEFGTDGQEVVIFDTGTTEPESAAYLGSIKQKVVKSPYRYITGVWKYVVENNLADSYLLLHDSMEILRKDWYRQFDGNGVTALAGFGMNFDNHQEAMWVKAHFPADPPPFGIFGCSFFAHQSDLEKVEIPESTEKLHDMGMERGWAIGFKQAGIPVTILIPDYNVLLSGGDGGTGIKKHFAHRQ